MTTASADRSPAARRRRRRWWPVPITLLLGAATSAGVAWWCAVLADLDAGGARFVERTHPDGTNLTESWRDGPGRTRIARVATETVRLDPDGRLVEMQPAVDSSDPSVGLHRRTGTEDRAGWPWRALASFDGREATVYGPHGFVLFGLRSPGRPVIGIDFGRDPSTGETRVLPTRILWPGFLADTALFTGAWLLLLLGPGAARRLHRRRHDRCPECGYDVFRAAGEGCPECGWGR